MAKVKYAAMAVFKSSSDRIGFIDAYKGETVFFYNSDAARAAGVHTMLVRCGKKNIDVDFKYLTKSEEDEPKTNEVKDESSSVE